jgi:cytochrome P450
LLTNQQITPAGPGTILRNVQTMLDFIGTTALHSKSRRGNLPIEVLPELNARLSHPIRPALSRPLLEDYPNIAGMYILLRITELVRAEKGRVWVEADALARATLAVLDQIVFRARTLGALPAWLPTPGNLRARRGLRILERAVWDTIHSRRAEATRPAPAADLLAMLMAARDEQTGQGMSDRQLRDEVMTMLIAGHETVASALAWTWYLLSTAPAAEARLHAEVDRVLAGRPPAAQDLANLPYTAMVFDEALRLYPPAWIITRRALADDEIVGYRIPAGALVVVSPYVTQRDARFWPDPDAFEPERFLPERAAARPRFAYYPFGGGPRLCIGNHFAAVEAGLVIATVAQRFRLRLAPGHQVAVEPSVTLRPRHGLWMTLHPRT